MNNPQISIVTVCYNAVDIIEKTILSVINQTYKIIEYIVIDGASTDGTIDVINKYNNSIAYFISEPDKGIYDAMNKGIMSASGEWIIFMNAGDVFYDYKVLHKICENISKMSTKVGCVYGDYVSQNKLRRVNVICDKPFYTKKNLVKSPGMGFHHQSCLVRTFLAKELLFDNLSFRLCADYNMIYQIYKKGYSFEHIATYVAIIDNGTGASASNRILQRREHYQILGLENTMMARLIVFRLWTEEKLKKMLFYDNVIVFLNKHFKKHIVL